MRFEEAFITDCTGWDMIDTYCVIFYGCTFREDFPVKNEKYKVFSLMIDLEESRLVVEDTEGETFLDVGIKIVLEN